jgi:predicted nucleic acid-binding Zn ribbon protein
VKGKIVKDITIYCAVCKKPIPEERLLLKAVTCSPQHTQVLANVRRRKRDSKNCRFCHAPSTLAERKLFKQWRDTIRVETRGRKKKPRPEPDTPGTASSGAPA